MRVEALERGVVVLYVDFGYGLVPAFVRFVYPEPESRKPTPDLVAFSRKNSMIDPRGRRRRNPPAQ